MGKVPPLNPSCHTLELWAVSVSHRGQKEKEEDDTIYDQLSVMEKKNFKLVNVKRDEP